MLYVLGGLAEEDIGLVPAGSYAFEGGLGIGIRLNFSESFGFQTRLTGSFGPVGSGTYDGFKGYTSDATGTTVAAEAGLRFGPYGSKAPFYVGVNLGGLGRFVSGEVTCNGFNGADRCFRRVDSDVPAGDIVTVDETIFGGTAGADAGFVLGSDEAFDIGAGFRFFSDFDGYRYSLLLRFGWAVL